MIALIDQTIKNLLIHDMSIKNGSVDIKFNQPKREWTAGLNKPTINFFLYDVRENPTLRRHQWDGVPANGARNGHVALRKRSPFRMDCHYMLTVWAKEPEDEHQLLSECMATLLRHPVLPREEEKESDRIMPRELLSQQYEIRTRLGAPDKLTNPAELWSALDNEIRPSLSYVVTVAVDPWSEVPVTKTKTFTVKYGQTPDPEARELLKEDSISSIKHYVRGIVHKNNKAQDPLEEVTVTIDDSPLEDYTDEDGQFGFGPIRADTYTLVAHDQDGKELGRKEITVPSQKGQTYDIAVK